MAESHKKDTETYTILEEADVPGATLKKYPEKCIVEELKRWLECHSLKKSGKKDELVSRVKDAMKMNLPVNPNVDGGKWYKIKARKTEDNAVPSTLSIDIEPLASPAYPSTSAINSSFSFGAVPSTSDAVQSTSSSDAIFPFQSDGWRLFPSRNIPKNFNYGHVYFFWLNLLRLQQWSVILVTQ